MNRLAYLLTTLACALLTSVACAQDAPPPVGQQPARGPGRPGFGFRLPSFPLLETLDADKDGKLSKEEIDNAVAALKKLDKDGDGKLSKEEIGWPPAGMGPGGPGGPGMGFGGPGGLGGGPGGGPGGPGGFGDGPGVNLVERILSNDKDGDGKVTRDELPEPMRRIMQRVDTNRDGVIDKAEAEAAAATMGRRGGFGRGSNPRGEQPKNPQPNPDGP
jgi:Ca2+-binding EF-hand superfamily protein